MRGRAPRHYYFRSLVCFDKALGRYYDFFYLLTPPPRVRLILARRRALKRLRHGCHLRHIYELPSQAYSTSDAGAIEFYREAALRRLMLLARPGEGEASPTPRHGRFR